MVFNGQEINIVFLNTANACPENLYHTCLYETDPGQAILFFQKRFKRLPNKIYQVTGTKTIQIPITEEEFTNARTFKN